MPGKEVEMSHELYIQILSAMFLFWNGARILTYLPTIGKLLAREADVRSHSLLSWGSWTISNGTFALMLLEMSRGIPNGMFWMNLANTLMCVIVSFIILFRRFPRLHTSLSKVYRRITRNESTADPVPPAPHSRFAHPGLWVASAGALAVGVVGAVAYDVWPNHHDQSANVDAKASTPPVLATTGPASPTQQPSSSGPVTPSTVRPALATTIAGTAAAPPTPSTSFEHRAPPRGSAAPRPATTQPRKAANGAPQNHGNWASHFWANLRQAFGITRPTPPKRQISSPGHGAPSSSASRGTAVSRAEIARHASSAPFSHGAAPSRDFTAQQFAKGPPGRAADFATQDRLRSARSVPVYEAPPTVVFEAAPGISYGGPPVVYQEPALMYAQVPDVNGRGYEDAHRDHRQWHDNGWHKGWKHRQREEDND
jgi:hypothetical protein